LGDGAAAILLSSAQEGCIKLRGAGIQTEGVSVTRPSGAGESLAHACLQIEDIQESPPDLIVAHGTATALNDPAEDQAFSTLFGSGEKSALVTATKSCIGHTLGASGAMDLIAACEVLKRQQVFCINNNSEVDPAFKSRYLHNGHKHLIPKKLSSVLVTSLGFGGVNAAAMVELQG
jgi:3-oxoacyl-(acyl-carrier-protein) synthase